MRSPVRQPFAFRRRLELGCRALALAALGVLLWRTWRAPVPAGAPVVARATSALPSVLARATRTAVGEIDLTVDSLPGARDRAWDRAVAAAGTRVRWRRSRAPAADTRSPATVVPIATALEPLADPTGRVRLVAMGPPGASLAIGDRAGNVDSTKLSPAGARVLDATLDGLVEARLPGGVASSAPRDSLAMHPVLVLAHAGWEGKFIVAALEEAGWKVDARFAVAPQVSVRQGSDVPLDTAHYAAVVVVDASAQPRAAAVVRFVREGGGVVVGGGAASLASIATILPARGTDPVSPTLGAVASETPRRGLDGVALAVTRNGAIVLERTGGHNRVVAARVGIGRVLVLGYDDTWRWRMEGGAESPRLHREWWSAMVASVVRTTPLPLTSVPDVDEMPYAALVGSLGSPDDSSDDSGAADGPRSSIDWEPMLFTLMLGGLLAEWGSRRLRGIR